MDFSFMKSGNSNFDDENVNKDLIKCAHSLIELFVVKALKIGTRYCLLANRNTLTKIDIEYALKYQAIEFMKITDIKKEMMNIQEEIESLFDEDDTSEVDDDCLEPDHEFARADPALAEKHLDAVFIKKMHHYFEYWPNWKTKNYFEEKIKQAIDTIS